MSQRYEIRVKGHLDNAWADWFDRLAIRHEANGETLLTGPLPDQGALHGVLNRLRDLGIELISVNPAPNAQAPGEEDADKPSS
jgi:hypothetical protein